MSNETASGDSNELEALFDSIASGVSAPRPVAFATPQPAPVAAPAPAASLMRQVREGDSLSEDNDDLQALFDSVASKPQAGAAAAVQDTDWAGQEKVFNQVGQMARLLHDTLGALGYDKLLEKTVHALPDAKDRLTYIANLTEQAACKVLNATDIANPLQEELENGAKLLADKWDAVYANRLSTQEFKLLADETRAYLKNAVPQRTGATREQLMEIMMAQDFQDLTGQVIKRMMDVVQEIEKQLLMVLMENIPEQPTKEKKPNDSLLNGPQLDQNGAGVIANQAQVDDLLDSLGF